MSSDNKKDEKRASRTTGSELSSTADEVKKIQEVKLQSITLPSVFDLPEPDEEPSLSSNKEAFLAELKKQAEEPVEYTVSVDTLQRRANYYKAKYSVNMVINGETPFGKQCNAARQAKYEILEQLQNDDLCYARYIYDIWVRPGMVRYSNDPGKNYACTRFVDMYIGENFVFKPETGSEQMASIYMDVRAYCAEGGENPPLLEKLKQINARCKTELPPATLEKLKLYGVQEYVESIQDSGLNLTHDEAIQEILAIQQKYLSDNETVAYFYTNGASGKGSNHVEVVLITRPWIIKPVVSSQPKGAHKSDKYIVSSDFQGTGFCDADISVLGPEYGEIQLDEETIGYGPIPPVAQASTKGCGTLALKHTENLLRYGAEQLREFTLQIPYYDKNGEVRYFFFSSPDVLYYSQSGTYNEALVALLFGNSPTVNIKCRVDTENGPVHKEFPFKTIKQLLEDTMQTAADRQDKEGFEYSKKLYEGLPEFCEQWYERYQKVSGKRGMMVEAKGKYNRALLYATRQYLVATKEYKAPPVSVTDPLVTFAPSTPEPSTKRRASLPQNPAKNPASFMARSLSMDDIASRRSADLTSQGKDAKTNPPLVRFAPSTPLVTSEPSTKRRASLPQNPAKNPTSFMARSLSMDDIASRRSADLTSQGKDAKTNPPSVRSSSTTSGFVEEDKTKKEPENVRQTDK